MNIIVYVIIISLSFSCFDKKIKHSIVYQADGIHKKSEDYVYSNGTIKTSILYQKNGIYKMAEYHYYEDNGYLKKMIEYQENTSTIKYSKCFSHLDQDKDEKCNTSKHIP